MNHSGSPISKLNPAMQAQAMAQLHPMPRQQPGIASICVAGPKGASYPPRKGKRVLVARTRNGGAWTEAAYWGRLRSALRLTYRFWRPALAALKAARVDSGRKARYLCADCDRLFPRKGVQIDHIEPVGALTSLEHLPDFLRRLTPESPAAFRIRCTACHGAKTAGERQGRTA